MSWPPDLPESNPYQFIRFRSPVNRTALSAQAGNDRTATDRLTGRVAFTVEPKPNIPILSIVRRGIEPCNLPAASLRGMVRSAAEILAPGCGAHIGLVKRLKGGSPTWRGREVAPDNELAFGDTRLGAVYWTVGATFPQSDQVPCDLVPDNAELIHEAEASNSEVDWSRFTLCPTCALFGMALHQACWRGRVQFGDGLLVGGEWLPFDNPVADPGMRLSLPSPHHQAHYFEPVGTRNLRSSYEKDDDATILEAGTLAGRKVYPHQGNVLRLIPARNQDWAAVRQTSEGARFSGLIRFRNLSPQELGLLLTALDLRRLAVGPNPPSLCHHYGFAKPAGYGSVSIVEVKVLLDSTERYSSWQTPAVVACVDRPYRDAFLQALGADPQWRNALVGLFSFPERPGRFNYPPFR